VAATSSLSFILYNCAVVRTLAKVEMLITVNANSPCPVQE
jgi:hypothetical protein